MKERQCGFRPGRLPLEPNTRGILVRVAQPEVFGTDRVPRGGCRISTELALSFARFTGTAGVTSAPKDQNRKSLESQLDSEKGACCRLSCCRDWMPWREFEIQPTSPASCICRVSGFTRSLLHRRSRVHRNMCEAERSRRSRDGLEVRRSPRPSCLLQVEKFTCPGVLASDWGRTRKSRGGWGGQS